MNKSQMLNFGLIDLIYTTGFCFALFRLYCTLVLPSSNKKYVTYVLFYRIPEPIDFGCLERLENIKGTLNILFIYFVIYLFIFTF